MQVTNTITTQGALRILLLGASGTTGRAVARAGIAAGHAMVCPVRCGTDVAALPQGPTYTETDFADAHWLASVQDRCGACDIVISCVASRSGAPKDAEAVDYGINSAALVYARQAGVKQFILLSAICVQKPRLAFQRAKLTFEADLIASGLAYSIVRPTAYFKSLSGQVDRLRAGKPYLLFGDGRLTACKPISDDDLAAYILGCIDTPERMQAILPIGGPGPALTPRDMGAYLFRALGRPPRYRRVPPALFRGMAAVLGVLELAFPPLRTKAEFLRIAHYYATESMLVWDPATETYDAEAAPETGSDTLFAHYDRLIASGASDARPGHAMF